jgi:hypothetical protein
MTLEDVQYIYKSSDIDRIRMNVYTESKHAKFMKSYGILIEKISLAELGKAKTIFIGLLNLIRQILLSFVVIYFREMAVFFILSFNFTCILMSFIRIHYKPYKDQMQ